MMMVTMMDNREGSERIEKIRTTHVDLLVIILRFSVIIPNIKT